MIHFYKVFFLVPPFQVAFGRLDILFDLVYVCDIVVDSKTTFLIAVILLFLFVGLFLEGIAAMLVLVPVLSLLLGAAVLTSKGSNTAAIIRHGSVSSSGYCYVSTLD